MVVEPYIEFSPAQILLKYDPYCGSLSQDETKLIVGQSNCVIQVFDITTFHLDGKYKCLSLIRLEDINRVLALPEYRKCVHKIVIVDNEYLVCGWSFKVKNYLSLVKYHGKEI